MSKPTQAEFICYALSHAKRETLPEGALLPCPPDAVGTEPWEYLYGTTGQPVTKKLLDERYENYYRTHGWSREAYDLATFGWVARGAWVCDCEGLLDSFLKEDVNAQYCYQYWCTDRGPVQDNKLYPIGTALFHADSSSGRMTHVGFVCGYANNTKGDLEPLVVEERGLRFGCVITRFNERPWTHRGLPTAKLDFSEDVQIWTEEDNMKPEKPVVFKLESPMMKGDDVRDLQKVMNYWGYRDDAGDELTEDGKLGKRTMQALTAFVEAHSELIGMQPAPAAIPYTVTIGDVVVADGEYTVEYD